MLDLSLLMQGQGGKPKSMEGSVDIALSLFNTELTPGDGTPSLEANFADVLASQLSVETLDNETPFDTTAFAEGTQTVGAIASLFIGNTQAVREPIMSPLVKDAGLTSEAIQDTQADMTNALPQLGGLTNADFGQGLTKDIALSKASDQSALSQFSSSVDKKSPLKEMVTNAVNTQQTVDGNEEPALSAVDHNLNHADKKINLLGDSKPVEAKSMGKVQAKKIDVDVKAAESAKAVDGRVTDNKSLKSSLTSNETQLEKMSKSLLRTEPNPTAANIVQNVQAAETGLQKVAGEQLSSNQINTPFSSPNWSQAVQQKVVWMVGAVDKSATLTLNPPELGPLKVVVQVDNQSVDTTFISENAEVRQVLQDSVSALKDRMLESGIQLGQTNIGSSAQSEQAFQQALKQQTNGQQATTKNDASQLHEQPTTSENTSATVSGDGLVDTFV